MTPPLSMLDLFAGRGGSSAAMVEHGWRVDRVELAPGLLERPLGVPAHLVTDHVADVRTFTWRGGPLDLVWASPPCPEFSRTSMPWLRARGAPPPSMQLVLAAMGVIATVRPTWWAIENVRGAIPWFKPWLGEPVAGMGPVFLWGRLPSLIDAPRRFYKARQSGTRPDLRSRIPFNVSLAVALAIEAAEGRRAA